MRFQGLVRPRLACRHQPRSHLHFGADGARACHEFNQSLVHTRIARRKSHTAPTAHLVSSREYRISMESGAIKRGVSVCGRQLGLRAQNHLARSLTVAVLMALDMRRAPTAVEVPLGARRPPSALRAEKRDQSTSTSDLSHWQPSCARRAKTAPRYRRFCRIISNTPRRCGRRLGRRGLRKAGRCGASRADVACGRSGGRGGA